MKVTRVTKWRKVVPFLDAQKIAQLKNSISDCAIFDFWQLEIKDFAQMLGGGVPDALLKKLQSKETTVQDAISIFNACEKFLKEFENVMKQYYIAPTDEETRAMRGVPEMTPYESMLVFCKNYFNHKDFGESEKITLIEYCIAKKDTFIQRMYAKNLEELRALKLK